MNVIHLDCADWFDHSTKLPLYHHMIEVALETKIQTTNRISDADIALVGPYGRDHHRSEFRSGRNLWKVFITGEPVLPDWRLVHHGLTFSPMGFYGRNHRFPIWLYDICWNERYHSVLNAEESEFLLEANQSPLLRAELPERLKKSITLFNNPELNRMFAYTALEKNGLCDAIGRPFCNELKWSGGNWREKVLLLTKYKANLCFENCIHRGYVSEKVFHSKLAGCHTITWGSVVRDVDFLGRDTTNFDDYTDIDDFVDDIKYVVENYSPDPNADIFHSRPTLSPTIEFLRGAFAEYRVSGHQILESASTLYANAPEPEVVSLSTNQLVSKARRVLSRVFSTT
jgi:hypothetical protein